MDALLDRIGLMVKARYPLLYLLSHEEDRVARGLARLARRQESTLWEWRSTHGLKPRSGKLLPDTESPIAALDAIAEVKEPGLFMMADFHVALEDYAVIRRLRDQVDSLGSRGQAIVMVAPRLVLPTELEKDMMVLDVPLPSRAEVSRLLKVLLKRENITLDSALTLRFVRASLGLTEREVKRAYAEILASGGRFGEGDLLRLAEVKQQAIRQTRFLELYEHVPEMDHVGGLGHLKQWLGIRAMAFSDEARKFGLPEPRGIFLLGVQGCGKSLTAKAVASLFQVPLLRLDAGALFRTRGKEEESLQGAIRIAESMSPVVLWIDELEKAFLMGDDQSGSRALGSFLTWLQEKEKPVFVVGTANEVRALPPELLRKGRFDEIFFVDLPDVHERLEILEIHLRARSRDPHDFELLQCAEETEKFSGAELEQLIIEALFAAFSEGERRLEDRDLLQVCRDTVPLAITMDDRLKQLREWARPRTRPATEDRRRIDFFDEFLEG